MSAGRRQAGAGTHPAAGVRAVLVVALALVVAALVRVGWPATGDRAAPGAAHVVPTRTGLARLHDPRGRTVLLRGVAVTALIRYGPGYAENPAAGDRDFAEIAALGFDFVRLPVSWSRIEPRPGVVDAGYLDRVAALVRDARRHGLSVLVDMHNDRYSAGLAPHDEADGAPAWATLVPSGCPGQPSPDDCQRAAWSSFWANRTVAGEGLQRHYLAALLAVSRRLRHAPGIAGFELVNNPSSGGTPSPAFERTQLWPFYRRAIRALRADGETRALWIDRAGSAERSDAVSPLPRLSGDGNLVLAPHDYAGVFSVPSWPAGGSARLGGWYAAAVHQAIGQHMGLAVGEWGGSAGGPGDGLLATKLGVQDATALGSSFWMWKQRPGYYNWELVNLDGSLRSDSLRAQMLSRPHPDAIPGRLDSFSFAGGALTVPLDGPGGTAVLWSGTQVLAGGRSAISAPLTHATVDGHPVGAALDPVGFRSGSVWLRGYRVRVRVPAGRHSLVLR